MDAQTYAYMHNKPSSVALLLDLLNTWVSNTTGKIQAAAARMAGSVVRPAKIQSRLQYVVKLKMVATDPPSHTDVEIKCRTKAARVPGVCDVVSAISRANRVCTATATASQICVVAKPS